MSVINSLKVASSQYTAASMGVDCLHRVYYRQLSHIGHHYLAYIDCQRKANSVFLPQFHKIADSVKCANVLTGKSKLFIFYCKTFSVTHTVNQRKIMLYKTIKYYNSILAYSKIMCYIKFFNI